ncbi:MAG TPA: hypothetical protein VF652_00390, partial [Allosphingosinicella sp.]
MDEGPEQAGEPLVEAVEGAAAAAAPVEQAPVAIPPVEDVREFDWAAVREAVAPAAVRSRIRSTVEAFEALLDREGGPGLLFDRFRSDPGDRAIKVGEIGPEAPL